MKRSRSGFTLIETVMSIVILAVAVPPMLWAVSEAQRQRINPMMASRARWLAVEKLEDIIADRHSISGSRGYPYVDASNYSPDNPAPGFTRSVAVAETAADLVSAGTGYKTVTVTVGWTNADGDAVSVGISTVLTDYSP